VVDGPDPDFVRTLRRRLALAVGRADELPTVTLPPRRNPVPTTTTTAAPTATAVTPYLCVHDAPAALDFYAAALGAVEVMRVADDAGRIGHAEIAIGTTRLYLSDEYPEMDVLSPRTLGAAGVALHLEVTDVDELFRTAVEAGAEELSPPADQPHGARHGTLRDPFGHRWMLSQHTEDVSDEELTRRMGEAGFSVTVSATPASAPPTGGIWAAVNSTDAPAMIRFLVDVVGFEADLVVPDAEPGVVAHSQLRWPEGGVVQVASAHRPGNVYSERAVGEESLYVITADPMAVHARCVEAGVEVIAPPTSPEYDPEGTNFSIRDHEGNIWTFGTYKGEG
jgi:PhnB protein